MALCLTWYSQQKFPANMEHTARLVTSMFRMYMCGIRSALTNCSRTFTWTVLKGSISPSLSILQGCSTQRVSQGVGTNSPEPRVSCILVPSATSRQSILVAAWCSIATIAVALLFKKEKEKKGTITNNMLI